MHSFFLGPASFSVTFNNTPIFGFSSVPGCFKDIIIPVEYFYGQSLTPPTEKLWKEKKDVLFWRGSATGGHQTPINNWKDYQRQRLAHLFGPNSTIAANDPTIDVGITDLYQDFGLDYIGGVAKRVAPQQIYESKYVIDVDGNVSTERFLSLLRWDELIFKSTIFRDWVLDRITPWVHYIPISLDYSDLLEKLEWARNNQEEAEIIVANAHEYSHSHMKKQDMKCYTLQLLEEYSKRYRSNE
jgi:hypothetical protein